MSMSGVGIPATSIAIAVVAAVASTTATVRFPIGTTNTLAASMVALVSALFVPLTSSRRTFPGAVTAK